MTTKYQFHLFNKFRHGFEDTEKCIKDGIKIFIFIENSQVLSLCKEHFDLVQDLIE